MQLTYCDICQALIKSGEEKYVLAINPVTQTDIGDYDERQQRDMQEYLKKYYQHQLFSKIKIYEICKECKDILTYLFKMKRQKREELSKEIDKLTQRGKKK